MIKIIPVDLYNSLKNYIITYQMPNPPRLLGNFSQNTLAQNEISFGITVKKINKMYKSISGGSENN